MESSILNETVTPNTYSWTTLAWLKNNGKVISFQKISVEKLKNKKQWGLKEYLIYLILS